MISRIFIDANIPTYAAGADHPLKDPCAQILGQAATQPGIFFTDAEVLQELLHRYLAIRRWPEGREILQRFAQVMRGYVESIHLADVEEAVNVADRLSGLSARDLLHLSVMARVGSSQLVSADRGFDGVPGIVRYDPANFTSWRSQLGGE